MRIVDDVELVDGDRIDGIAPGALESLAQIATITDCAAARAIDGQREFVARPWLVIDEAEAKLFDETARFAGGTSHRALEFGLVHGGCSFEEVGMEDELCGGTASATGDHTGRVE
jgi:hypothetical protein